MSRSDPLLQFLALGAVLFVGTQLLGQWRAQTERSIVVDAARVQHLAEMYRVQMGASPSPRELEHLVDSFIREEILYREALRLGLNRDDEIVRRRLAQKMEFLISDVVVLPEPGESELRAFHERRAERFSTPATATFSHAYFSPDARGDDGARLAATRALSEPRDGDPFPLQRDYTRLSLPEIARIFGDTPFTNAVFSQAQDRWAGPLRSGYGWHLVFVRQREPAVLRPFAQVREQVREAYLDELRRAANEERLAALRESYTVVRTDPETSSP